MILVRVLILVIIQATNPCQNSPLRLAAMRSWLGEFSYESCSRQYKI